MVEEWPWLIHLFNEVNVYRKVVAVANFIGLVSQRIAFVLPGGLDHKGLVVDACFPIPIRGKILSN
jgi:hypothetical protein